MTVLVDTATTTAARDGFVFRAAGHRLLKGFDAPIEVFSLMRRRCRDRFPTISPLGNQTIAATVTPGCGGRVPMGNDQGENRPCP
ncbi:MAG TPA: hypothetical protein VMU64_14230 [Acidimicrobiales bacterium]|nr:hypothetical protein [Acidimicrobiales bacterium]